MGYYSKNRKDKVYPQIRQVFKKYGVKGTIAVDKDTTSLVISLKSAPTTFDFKIKEKGTDCNLIHYGIFYDGITKMFLHDIVHAIIENEENHDGSLSPINIRDITLYATVKLGYWNKPFIYTE